jgi:hypothetical protein
MTLHRLLVAVLIICLCLVSVSGRRAVAWQKIDADGLFTFRLPRGFIKTGMTGREFYLGEYYKGKTRFLFIWGDSASVSYDIRRQPYMADYQETETRIDGRRANLRTFSQIRNGERFYRAELNIGDWEKPVTRRSTWEKGNVDLYMEVESKNPANLGLAKQIFNSINFSKERRADGCDTRNLLSDKHGDHVADLRCARIYRPNGGE